MVSMFIQSKGSYGAGLAPWDISSGGLPWPKVLVGVVLTDPVVGDGVFVRTPGVWVRFLRNPEPFF
jgi:hypothetical protein